tara:strand:+ start:627 stop:893 length:267 start_codon:yes stop_codon:yes gene_type:complete
MSFAITAAAVIIGGTSLYSSIKAEEAQDEAEEDAKKQAIKDKERAASEEAFSRDEGGGIGSLGKINLAIDDDLEDDQLNNRVGGRLSL